MSSRIYMYGGLRTDDRTRATLAGSENHAIWIDMVLRSVRRRTRITTNGRYGLLG